MALAPIVRRVNTNRDSGHWAASVSPAIYFQSGQGISMKKLTEVEAAKELMTEAMKWSVMRWLREKKRVRKTADQANAALDQLSDDIKQNWSSNLRSAYEALGAGNGSQSVPRNSHSSNGQSAVNRCKQADNEARRAREDAEETFDRAERLLSTSVAREGCLKAIQSWELKQKAIRLAEELEG